MIIGHRSANRSQLAAALEAYDVAWSERSELRVHNLRAAEAAEHARLAAIAAAEALSRGVDAVFEARKALKALVLPPPEGAE